MKEKIFTMGVDVGGSYVKGILMSYSNGKVAQDGLNTIIDKKTEKIRKRNPVEVATGLVNALLDSNGLKFQDIAYLASTGEGEMVRRKTGHFYSMTTHSRGGKFFCPHAKTIVDMGALYVRAIKVNEQGRVMGYKMTGQCASGSGQFVENISRYLGLAIEEVGDISIQADEPEIPSGICAVLAETDVINSVSRGITTPNIIKGIHLSVANRVVRLLSSLKAESPVALVGGLAMNKGMIQAVKELTSGKNKIFEIITHQDAIYSGAVGAALWGGYRYYKLKEKKAAVVS